MSGLTCDMCNSKEYNAGVACSGLGAMSFSYCMVCLAMGAEMEGLIKDMFPPGSPEHHEFVYYKNGSYYSYPGDKLQVIKLEDGREFKTRQEVIDIWNKGKEKKSE